MVKQTIKTLTGSCFILNKVPNGYSLCSAFLCSMCVWYHTYKRLDTDCKTFQSCNSVIHLGSGKIHLILLQGMDLPHGPPRNGFYWLSFYRYSSPLRTYARDKPLWSKVGWSNHAFMTVRTIPSHHHWLCVQMSCCRWLSIAAWNKAQDSSVVQTRSNLTYPLFTCPWGR